METRATSPAADAFPIGRSMLLGFAMAIVLALIVAGTIYLSMIDHGHSFARLFGWQLGNWGCWALICPLVLRFGGGLLSGGRPLASRVALAVALGLALMAIHDVVLAAFTIWMRPFYPLGSGSFIGNLIGQLPSLVVINGFVYTLLLVGRSEEHTSE